MERILCLAVGYAFGLIQTGYFYGKAHGVDIRKHGSGNSGTTNALRVLGTKSRTDCICRRLFKNHLIPASW